MAKFNMNNAAQLSTLLASIHMRGLEQQISNLLAYSVKRANSVGKLHSRSWV
jgi:hypothetical protein